jgi:hypothetical protein
MAVVDRSWLVWAGGAGLADMRDGRPGSPPDGQSASSTRLDAAFRSVIVQLIG